MPNRLKAHALKWLAKYGGLAVFYLAFIASATIFTKNRIKYSGVQNWPSVAATNISSSNRSYTIRTEQRHHGSGTTTIDADEVSYDYVVNGITYIGNTVSPNGGKLPPVALISVVSSDGEQSSSSNMSPSRRAYYKPEDPSIAVLDPSPYHGNTAMIVFGGLSAVVVLVHLLSELLPRLKRIDKPIKS